jgi:vacuolar-type H+-ATPase subunit I/STV1
MSFLQILQTILAFMNICVLAYAFLKFLGKPHNSLEEQIKSLQNELEGLKDELKDVKKAILQGEVRYQEQEETNQVIQTCVLVLVDYEIGYCIRTGYEDTGDLLKAKEMLREHLAKR